MPGDFSADPHQFDAVITDQTMPGLTGLDLARRMLEHPAGPADDPLHRSQQSGRRGPGQGLGHQGFAMKPLTKKEIAARSGRRWPIRRKLLPAGLQNLSRDTL